MRLAYRPVSIRAVATACAFAAIGFGLLSDRTLAEESWPQFRGPTGQGHTTLTSLPVEWNATKGEESNVVWRTTIPGLGWSSPSWKDGRAWVTSANVEDGTLHVYAVDLASGEIALDKVVFDKESLGRVHGKNSHASPSCVLEDDRVYVHFGAHGTACLTEAGEIVWSKVLKHDHSHGPGNSPVLFEDLLIVNCDGRDAQFLVGLDKHTGDERWRTVRKHVAPDRGKDRIAGIGFSTPLVATIEGKPQVISVGADHVAGYDPRTGEEIWWVTYDGYSNVPRPVIGDGLLYVATGYEEPKLLAIPVGGTGDLTEQVVWTMDRDAPLNPSPILVDDLLYTVSDRGIAKCVEATTGEEVWKERLGGEFSASFVYGDGKLFVTDEKGATYVLKPGREFELLAENPSDGRSLATPSPLPGGWLLRTESELIRIGVKP
jgi:outer membrane protein assembly factor BamB